MFGLELALLTQMFTSQLLDWSWSIRASVLVNDLVKILSELGPAAGEGITNCYRLSSGGLTDTEDTADGATAEKSLTPLLALISLCLDCCLTSCCT